MMAVYDTLDKCWIGNAQGVVTFTDEEKARGCATIINEQFNSGARFRAQHYAGNATKFKDSMVPPISGEEAVKRIEAKVK